MGVYCNRCSIGWSTTRFDSARRALGWSTPVNWSLLPYPHGAPRRLAVTTMSQEEAERSHSTQHFRRRANCVHRIHATSYTTSCITASTSGARGPRCSSHTCAELPRRQQLRYQALLPNQGGHSPLPQVHGQAELPYLLACSLTWQPRAATRPEPSSWTTTGAAAAGGATETSATTTGATGATGVTATGVPAATATGAAATGAVAATATGATAAGGAPATNATTGATGATAADHPMAAGGAKATNATTTAATGATGATWRRVYRQPPRLVRRQRVVVTEATLTQRRRTRLARRRRVVQL